MLTTFIVVLTAVFLVSFDATASNVDPAAYGLEGHEYVNVRCKPLGGGRKAVWANTDKGTYALNGQAMTWFNETKAIGSPLIGTDGKPWKIARDVLPIGGKCMDLIQVGLKECS